MAPADLANLLDSYFAAMFEPIQNNGGTVTGVVGDGIMSVWTAPQPDRASRLGAALAAFDLTSAVEQFNRQCPGRPMPTQIGLHTGWTMLGNVGGKGHFAWSVVGDIPNTASRIEGLNKHLGTRMVASGTVVGDLDELLLPPSRRFRLVGKADAIDVYELPRPAARRRPNSTVWRTGSPKPWKSAKPVALGRPPKCSIESLKTSRMTDRRGFTWSVAGNTRP